MMTPSNDPAPVVAIEVGHTQATDETQLRKRLLQLIVKSEARRRASAIGSRPNRRAIAGSRNAKNQA